MARRLTHLSLFSGIGGLDLSAEWAGFTTVGQCEWADYPTMVLEKHWPDVPRWRDIRTLTGDSFYERTGLRTVDVISGGFPCQPFSVAGKQKGKADERYLWPEMLRVIRSLAPRFIVGENVPGILRIAAGQVVEDLEREGYDVAVFDFEAAAVGAPHYRRRVCFVGCKSWAGQMANKQRDIGWTTPNVENTDSRGRSEQAILPQQQGRTEFLRDGADVADAPCCRLQRVRAGLQQISRTRPDTSQSERVRDVSNTEGPECDRSKRSPKPTGVTRFADRMWWATEPNVCRVANGIPHRVDRIKCLGNAVVPQQFFPIFSAIAQELNKEDKAT